MPVSSYRTACVRPRLLSKTSSVVTDGWWNFQSLSSGLYQHSTPILARCRHSSRQLRAESVAKMSRRVSLGAFLVPLLFGAFLCDAEASTQCAPQQFECANGKCTPLWYVCNGNNNCGDNSDELVCDPFHCHPAAFQCSNGKCIPRRLLCYLGDHCGDNSDELHCNPNSCHPAAFQCLNGKCNSPFYFCAYGDQCGDNSDERYCNIDSSVPCPPGWVRCPSGRRCIPSGWVCDGFNHCDSTITEETNCGNNSAPTPEYTEAKADLKSRLLGRRRPGSGGDRWGSQVPRIAVALHLADNSTFGPGNSTGEEIRNELTIRLLHRLAKDRRMSSQELALHVHALLVSCVDPRDFHGEDLVRELRGRVEASGNRTDPFLVLVLCNAGDAVTDRDVRRVTDAFHSQHRPFWTGNNSAPSPTIPAVTSPEYTEAKADLKSRLLGRRRPGSGRDRWGSQVSRIAVALHLADNSTFGPGNSTGDEIRNELTIRLLHRLAKDRRMSSQELALHVHALLVSCVDPRDFHGEDLVRELRGRVEASGNHTDPFLVLVLCNAGDAVTDRDVRRVTDAFHSQHRPFWTDSQALSCMALSCLSSRSGVSVDERILEDMLQELKRRQFRNGTVDNLRTTALVTQALFIHESYKKDFDLDSAMKALTNGLNGSRSLLDAYYALPSLSRKSLLNVTSGHCNKQPVAEEEALEKAMDVAGETMTVHYSVWMGDEINVGRTWRLRMRANSTIYDAMETVARIDSRQKVQYDVVDGKPYVAALNGKEDDPEMGTFWFLYVKYLSSDKEPKIVEESPVDVKLQPNQEIIMWYKRAPWSSQGLTQKSLASS